MPNNNISSSEFSALCQSQITLLSKGLGAVWSVIYLTEETSKDGQPRLFPLAIYPQNKSALELPAVKLCEVWQQVAQSTGQLLLGNLSTSNNNTPSKKSRLKTEPAERKQLILPLIHQEAFIGLLVTGREDRDWQPGELTQIEEIARTIAIARFMGLQHHWTQEKLALQENLRRIERDRLDDLFHQLRNPLTALRTFGKLLLKRLLPGDPNHKIAQNLLEQGDRFQKLLEQFEAESEKFGLANSNLLNSSLSPVLEASNNTVVQGNFLLPSSKNKLNSIDLKQILEPLIVTAEAIALERNIGLTYNVPITVPLVVGDFSALREIFNNLIDNALKYTPPGGKVQLNLLTKRPVDKTEMLGIAIQDNGYGIPLEDQKHVFERHFRGAQGKSNIPGTGLGLAIAQELVLKMQGEIELVSPNNLSEDSPGTTLIVWLPLVN